MPSFDDLSQWMTRRLEYPLPGPAVQTRFAPELTYGRHQSVPFPDTRQAAVLILLFPQQDQWLIPFTVRPETMSTHAGQVSFPGGEIEPGETIEEAALREYTEELGAAPRGMILLGRLTRMFVFASNYLVTPCVAACPERPRFQPSPAEVAQVVEAPIGELAHSDNHGTHCIRRAGVRFQAPHYDRDGYRIWGATSMMLCELLALWNEYQSQTA